MEGGRSQEQHNTAFTWFTEFQLQSVIRNGIVPEWFHGIISRKTAEDLLLSKPPGYFLIRVSESRIGYSLSYRVEDRCRHFMIDALKDGHYVIVGENTRHRLLQDLVDFHCRTPIMPFNEVLTVPCGQISKDKTDYAELLYPKRHVTNPNIGPLLNNSLHPNNKSHLKPPEDIPPALPHRPDTLSSGLPSPNVTKMPAVPNNQPNTLYPCLEDEVSHFMSQIPAVPVPLPRKRYTANTTQPEQPPEVPARSSIPPQKQNQACTSTNSAPESPSALGRLVTQSAGQEDDHPHSANSQSERNQDMKPAVVINLINLKRRFQKKRCTSREHMYAEISVEAEERQKGRLENENTENEYQELPGEQTIDEVPFTTPGTTMTLTDSGLPQEYLPPPPFAPGY